MESLEYLLEAIVDNLHNGKTVIAVRYAGVLGHLLEDSTSPAHCPVPFDEKFIYIRDLLPPPSGKEKIELHPALEITAPERVAQTARGCGLRLFVGCAIDQIRVRGSEGTSHRGR